MRGIPHEAPIDARALNSRRSFSALHSPLELRAQLEAQRARHVVDIAVAVDFQIGIQLAVTTDPENVEGRIVLEIESIEHVHARRQCEIADHEAFRRLEVDGAIPPHLAAHEEAAGAGGA
jgi:hypothetical protein